MYIDLDTKKLLPVLPLTYKHTSNFSALSDSEINLFNVYKVNSFIQDENYITLREVLSTPYFYSDIISIEPGQQEPGTNVKIILDKNLIIKRINETKNQTGNFISAGHAIEGFVVEEIKNVQLERNRPEYSFIDLESYIFIWMGKSKLVNNDKKNNNNFKYLLQRTNISTFDNYFKKDFKIYQDTGFEGKISLVDKSFQIIKLENCINIDLIDIKKNFYCDSTTIECKDIFSIELYRKIDQFNSKNVILNNINNSLNNIIIFTVINNEDIELSNTFSSGGIKIESEGHNTDSGRSRILNNYGRLV